MLTLRQLQGGPTKVGCALHSRRKLAPGDKRLRIAVELIDAASESALWSDRFELDLEDLFDLQEEIAGAVAARLSVQIDIAEGGRNRLIRATCALMAS